MEEYITDLDYVTGTVKEDLPRICAEAARRSRKRWWPPADTVLLIAEYYAAGNPLDNALWDQAEIDMNRSAVVRKEVKRFLRKHYLSSASARRNPEGAKALLKDCEALADNEEGILRLLIKYRKRLSGMPEDDNAFEIEAQVWRSAQHLVCDVRNVMHKTTLRTGKPRLTWDDMRARLRAEREEERQEALRKAEAKRKIANGKAPKDLTYGEVLVDIDDIEKLCAVLRESDDRAAVEAALEKIRRLRADDDIEIVKACLPGRRTWPIVEWLSSRADKWDFRYLTENGLVRTVVPALQRERCYSAEDLLEHFYERKYGHLLNRTWENKVHQEAAERQFAAAKTPEEAFRGIDPDEYDRWFPDHIDESVIYINPPWISEKPFAIDGMDLHDWRMKCLCKADLLTEED